MKNKKLFGALLILAVATGIYASGGGGNTSGGSTTFSGLTGNIATSQMNSGTSASASTFWRGDATWAAPTVSSVASSIITGTVAAGDPTAGNLGEYMTTNLLEGAAIVYGNNTNTDIMHITLTAGDWDVSALCCVTGTNAVTTAQWNCSVSTASATQGTLGDSLSQSWLNYSGGNSDQCQSVPAVRINVNTGTSAYMVHRIISATSNMGGYGRISARRVR